MASLEKHCAVLRLLFLRGRDYPAGSHCLCHGVAACALKGRPACFAGKGGWPIFPVFRGDLLLRKCVLIPNHRGASVSIVGHALIVWEKGFHGETGKWITVDHACCRWPSSWSRRHGPKRNQRPLRWAIVPAWIVMQTKRLPPPMRRERNFRCL